MNAIVNQPAPSGDTGSVSSHHDQEIARLQRQLDSTQADLRLLRHAEFDRVERTRITCRGALILAALATVCWAVMTYLASQVSHIDPNALLPGQPSEWISTVRHYCVICLLVLGGIWLAA